MSIVRFSNPRPEQNRSNWTCFFPKDVAFNQYKIIYHSSTDLKTHHINIVTYLSACNYLLQTLIKYFYLYMASNTHPFFHINLLSHTFLIVYRAVFSTPISLRHLVLIFVMHLRPSNAKLVFQLLTISFDLFLRRDSSRHLSLFFNHITVFFLHKENSELVRIFSSQSSGSRKALVIVSLFP